MIFNGMLSVKQQVSKLCQSTYLELSRISSVRHVLTVLATRTLSYPWYSRVLTTVTLFCQKCPNSSLTNFERFRIVLPDLIFKPSKRAYASPLLAKLHWLLVAHRIEYKVSSICYNVVSKSARLYLFYV